MLPWALWTKMSCMSSRDSSIMFNNAFAIKSFTFDFNCQIITTSTSIRKLFWGFFCSPFCCSFDVISILLAHGALSSVKAYLQFDISAFLLVLVLPLSNHDLCEIGREDLKFAIGRTRSGSQQENLFMFAFVCSRWKNLIICKTYERTFF